MKINRPAEPKKTKPIKLAPSTTFRASSEHVEWGQFHNPALTEGAGTRKKSLSAANLLTG
ncbi:MAG: hypothetical protein A2168_00600 [Planctomycetes bacterium RBG_13_50_24]|nr:MAG: hypothetical protein A2168_00600 [Planctomycetes bacterium RBG_13_50_24]